jgi:hypothetical protein
MNINIELSIKDVEVTNDKEDTRSLHITIHKPVSNAYVKSNPPILNAKFTFDDHIRCMTAKQNLSKGRQRYFIFFFYFKILKFVSRARQIKLSKIASILDIPAAATTTTTTANQSNYLTSATTTYSQHQFGKGLNLIIVRNSPGE